MPDALTPALSHRSEGSPQNNACTDGSLSLVGEGWGEGEHTALVVIPFTLCSLLLCHNITCEHARVAQRIAESLQSFSNQFIALR